MLYKRLIYSIFEDSRKILTLHVVGTFTHSFDIPDLTIGLTFDMGRITRL